jgi:ABC-type phosphate transport system substrate-binding protein
MRQLRTLWIVMVLGAVAARRLACADIKVIANPDVGAVSATSAEIKAVFLGTKDSLSDGSHVQPVILKGSPCDSFARSYIGKSGAGLVTYYRELVFSGTGVIPKMFASENELIAYVSRTRGAIGYVSSGTATSGVKVLAVR